MAILDTLLAFHYNNKEMPDYDHSGIAARKYGAIWDSRLQEFNKVVNLYGRHTPPRSAHHELEMLAAFSEENIKAEIEKVATHILSNPNYLERYAYHKYLKFFCKHSGFTFPPSLPKILKSFNKRVDNGQTYPRIKISCLTTRKLVSWRGALYLRTSEQKLSLWQESTLEQVESKIHDSTESMIKSLLQDAEKRKGSILDFAKQALPELQNRARAAWEASTKPSKPTKTPSGRTTS